MSPPTFVLASGSPRRSAILDLLGIRHAVDPADVEERPREGESAEAYVQRLAREKASRVARRQPGRMVLAGDTVVLLDGEILEKPAGPDAAARMLVALAGRRHRVATGLALAVPGQLLSRVDTAEVLMRDFDRGVAERYVATGEPMDKAGGYGIQGRGAALVRRVEGDYYTVVGLPVSGLLDLLEGAGYRYAFGGGLEPTARASPKGGEPSRSTRRRPPPERGPAR